MNEILIKTETILKRKTNALCMQINIKANGNAATVTNE